MIRIDVVDEWATRHESIPATVVVLRARSRDYKNPSITDEQDIEKGVSAEDEKSWMVWFMSSSQRL
jgi:hypothetical protein